MNLTLEDSPYKLDEFSPIFILGCPRSGTTFLSSCISSIDVIEEFVGVLAPPRMMHLIGEKAEKGADYKSLTLLMRDIFWQSFWQRVLFFNNRIGPIVSKKKYGQLFKKPQIEDRIFCYKEPFMCFAMKQVAEEFPNAKFIHIIRDGRDNADSMERSYPMALSDETLKSKHLIQNKSSEIGVFYEHGEFHIPWWVPKTRAEEFIATSQYGRFVWMWSEMVKRATDTGAELDKSRYIEVRYEEVVSEPTKSAEKILNFINFDMSPRLYKSLKGGHQKSVGISKKNQKENKLKEAHSIAGDLLESLGYQ